MIHALLFVTQNNRDRDGHGPEFCKHMNRINKASGTKITVGASSLMHFKHSAAIVLSCFHYVQRFPSQNNHLQPHFPLSPHFQIYHSFHDEVDVYRQHWWRCNGPCQNRKPYFGYVKRAMNRAPSALDPWWGDHQRTCGGTYTKVKEPEGYSKKGKKDAKKDEKTSENKASGNRKSAGTMTEFDPLLLMAVMRWRRCS